MKKKKEVEVEVPVEDFVTDEEVEEVPTPCNYPAPVVVNGGIFCGCQKVKDHEDQHEVRISWVR